MYQTKRVKINAWKVENEGLPEWLQQYTSKLWGEEGSVKPSGTKKGFALAYMTNKKREYIESGEYIIDFFGRPLRMIAEDFERLFTRGTTKSKNTDS